MRGLLKFITCGSVDDGKSTLIGHMLYDAKLLFEDQEKALEADSRRGSRDQEIDYSLLLDGLVAEREQGITIDVAYRYFATNVRSFIVADTPGHEEYTRNMAVGASYADLAVILVDATKGVLVQTRRHARICSLMGIRHVVFAINKMDLIQYDQTQFREIEREIIKMNQEFQYESLYLIPVSATEGDNVTVVSDKMPWYQGQSLLAYLETIETEREDKGDGFIMPVQRVSRPDSSFRGFQGQVERGESTVGAEITVLPSRENVRVKSILVTDQEAETATAGQPVTIVLDREVDVSRGCVLEKDDDLHVGSMFAASILWMDDNCLAIGRNFTLKLGTQMIPATIMNIKYKIDVNTGAEVYAETIYKNEIAVCELSVGSRIVFDKFENHRELGSLILIDRITNMTSACGVVRNVLERDRCLTWQSMDITRSLRESQLNQRASTIWFTGLSGAGKSTLANALEKRLFSLGKHTMLLDGDNVRMGLNKNLGFDEKDRIENIRRIAEVAKLMNDGGLIVLTSFISPYRLDRRNAKEIIGENYFEIYVSTPMDECEKRDVKGLYKEARAGHLSQFTGISSLYEVPENPDIIVDTSINSVEQCVDFILKGLEEIL